MESEENRQMSFQELRQTLGYNGANLPEESIHHSFHQLLKTISNSSAKGFELESANSILVDNRLQLHPEYKKSVQDLYMSPVRSVDFRTNSEQIKKSVNEWVESKTGGMIKELLKDMDPETTLVLLNAVYFKGKWKDPFKESETMKDNFYNRGLPSPKKVDMMNKYNSRFSYYTDWDSREYQALELPYEGEQLSMLVLLPRFNNGLTSLERNLTASKLQDIRRRMWSEKFHITLPKFKLEFEKDLVPELKNLGLKGIFKDDEALKEYADDFSGMMSLRDSQMLSVTDVIHKCKVEVNEEGTKAAGATALRFTYPTSERMGPTYVFRADHPFLFFIIEKVTGLILFMGRVSEL